MYLERIIMLRTKILTVLLLILTGSFLYGQNAKELVDYVDPNIGGIGHMLQPTLPTVQLPNCMIRIAPSKGTNLDKYLADKINEFPLNITSHRIADAFGIMATSGNLKVKKFDYASAYDHDNETATPYYYSVALEDYDINAEYTVTEHSAFFRFGFTRPEDSHILLRAQRKGKIEIVDNNTVRGYEDDENVRYFFYAKFDKPFESSGTYQGSEINQGSTSAEGENIGGFMNYRFSKEETVGVKVGISYISLEQAKENLEKEIPAWDFSGLKDRARTIWNNTLAKIKVEGGTDKQKRIFYTALYRAHERMVNVSEYGKYFSGYDQKIHDDAGQSFYVDDWLWDTYRCLHPLHILISPEMQINKLRSYVRMYEQSGWMPSFPLLRGDHACMIGQHAASIFADAYLKGVKDFDVEKAYEGLKKNACDATLLPWANGPKTELDDVYLTKGFFPALPEGEKEWVKEVHPFERRQAVAVTLENCYDDWCLAQLAKALNKNDDYEYFMKRAYNYMNLYNTQTGFMSPKTADGNWVPNFDPKLSGGQGGRAYFAECNSWTYTWSVQHDVAGLMNLMGGRENFLKRLDQLFNEPLNTEKFFFLGQFPDASGLVGEFAMGDEPSFHIPYLYNYAGAPWKTQKRVRELMNVWYDDDPLGICGDEDGGALSTWYIFSAMGFYPVTPGRPTYDIGSPVFSKVTINLGDNKSFTVQADNVSPKNKYIQSASLNGKPLNIPWFEHSDIKDGGSLVLEMGPKPNKQWGNTTQVAIPSMSTEKQ